MLEKKSVKNKILVSLLLFVLMISFCMPIVATAADTNTTIEYTDVLDDLTKDESFDTGKYPSYTYAQIEEFNKNDVKDDDMQLLEVISMAEGNNGELFVYVYNPTKAELNITATEILMYDEDVRTISDEFKPKPYALECVSKNSVFDKYLVKDFEVCDEPYRFYNIVEISRPFNKEIDDHIEGGTTDDKGIPVAKQWCFYKFNGNMVCEVGDIDVVEITPTLTDFILCEQGLQWINLIGKSEISNLQYIAFNVENFDVEDIYDADLRYTPVPYTQDMKLSMEGTTWFVPEYESELAVEEIFLSKSENTTREGEGLWGKTYTFKEIMSAGDFLTSCQKQNLDVGSEEYEKLSQSEWVFIFDITETTRQLVFSNPVNGIYKYRYTGIEAKKVDVVRLHFLTESGDVYNLGVVMDKTTADRNPGIVGSGIDMDLVEDWFEKLMAILAVLVLVILIGVLTPYLTGVFNVVVAFLKVFLKGLLIIISAPFKLVAGLFKPKGKK